MKPDVVVTSQPAVLLVSLHLAGDIVRGMEPDNRANLAILVLIVVWLSGTLLLHGRRAGYTILILGVLAGSGIAIVPGAFALSEPGPAHSASAVVRPR